MEPESVQKTTEEEVETEQQKEARILLDLINNQGHLQEGENYYLLVVSWWNNWKYWSGYAKTERWTDYHSRDRIWPKPGPIDNSSLLDESEGPDVVKKGKSDTYDFVILSRTVWNQFLEWYGGGPPIIRPCIRQASAYQASLVVEVRQLKLKVIWSRKPKAILEKWFSKACTIGKFIETMAKDWKFDRAKIRVYDFHNARKLKQLDKMEKHMDEVQILDGQYMLIEEQKKDGTWPNDKIYRHLQQQSQSYYNRIPTPAGCTGLSNLGNTCFMNSGIQCLSSTAPLVDFFLTDQYLSQINRDNPLGMKGEFATVYAHLLRELWSNNTAVSTPRDFKNVISKYAPQFTGYAQHDSHELLAFLLDGLHEDLNRIKNKPYVETKDSNGRPDEEVAAEAWAGYKKRNDSIIVDLFQGQLKSRLKCPEDKRVSNQFDPFMYLSVPIPIKNTRKIIFTYYPRDLDIPPRKFGISIEKFAGIWTLKEKMGQLLNVTPQSLVILDLFANRFHREWKNHEDVADIRENDVVVVYEVVGTSEDVLASTRRKDTDAKPPEREYLRLPIFVRDEEANSSGYSYRPPCRGDPFVISIHKDSTYSELYNAIINYLTKRNHFRIPEGKDKSNLFSIQFYQQYQQKNFTQDASSTDPIAVTDRESLVIELKKEGRAYYEEEPNQVVQVDASAASRVETGGKDVVSLIDCLEIFTSEEQLGANDAWYCSHCKEFRQAHKKFDIWTAPQLLVVQLKRFSQVNRVWRDRLDNLVEFPIDNLDLTKYVLGPKDQPPIYDLYAVSNHFGSMGGGHYTAFARHRNNNKWYRYDDSSVTEVNQSEIVSRAAYVLFYKRKDVNWPAFDPSLDRVEKSEEEDDNDDGYEDEDENMELEGNENAAPPAAGAETPSTEIMVVSTTDTPSTSSNTTSLIQQDDTPQSMDELATPPIGG